MDHPQMRVIRLFLYFAVGLLIGGVSVLSHAASVPLRTPSNIGGSPGSYITTGSTAFSGLAFNSGLTTNVGGIPIVVPAAWRLAANAGQFAVGMVRANPAGLVAGAVAAWMLTEGIEWVEGQFRKSTAVPGQTYGVWANPYFYHPASGQFSGSLRDAADLAAAGIRSMNGPSNCPAGVYGPYCPGPGQLQCTYSGGINYSCTGYVSAVTIQWKGDYSPPYGIPSETDWSNLAGKLNDAVAGQLSPYGLPLQNPQVNRVPQKYPLSDPYYDPVTKKWYRDVVTLTPGADGGTAEAQVGKEEVVDEEGEPVVDEEGAPVIEEETDPCKLNPDSLACLNVGEPEDVDLPTRDVQVAINPVGGFGADNATCPADENASLRNGMQIGMSYGPVCQMATAFRPVILGFAWLSAALLFVGIVRRNS